MSDHAPSSADLALPILAPPGARGMHHLEHVMGLPVLVDVCQPVVSETALQAAIDWLHEVDRRFSTYRADSEISRLNRGELSAAELHPDVQFVLERCRALERETDGYFDIRAPYLGDGLGPEAGLGGPASVDPSGFVKGWAIDGVVARLRAAGATNLSVNAGGDVAVNGHPDDEPAWHIGVQHPRSANQIAFAVALDAGAVATSGTYVRGQHIIDPFTGRPPEGLLSVTILGPDMATADAYATAAFAMGADRAAVWCSHLSGYEAVLIRADDTVLSTPGVERLRL